MPLARLLTRLGLGPAGAPPPDDPFVRALHEELQRLGAERLEYLAGFAGQLARVAHVEGGISDEEAAAIGAQLRAHGGLGATEAEVVVGLLRHQLAVLRTVQNHLLNRAINAHASPAEKATVVDCLYAVAAADHLVSDVEEREIRRIAEALLVPHSVLIDIRSRYRDRLETLQRMRRDTGRGPSVRKA